MLIVTVEFRVAPAKRGAFVALAGELTAPTQAEDGCRAFDFWADLGDPGRFLLFELWESEAHLEAHRGTPHVEAFKRATASLGLEAMEIERYPVAR